MKSECPVHVAIGESIAESGRWPVQLASMLHRSGIDLADPRIIAKTGWTTDELSVAIDAEQIVQ